MRTTLLIAMSLALLGCGARQKPAEKADGGTASAPSTQPAPEADVEVASGPTEITELTNQGIVYECHKCGMMFDGPGRCTMDQSELYPAKITYICPADHLPVDHAGKCPRCNMNARIMKTAMGPEGTKVTQLR